MNAIQEILDDLLRDFPMEVVTPIAPYTDNMSFREKFESALKSLERSKRMGNRMLQLINAFYLGRLLEIEAESLTQRSYFAQKLSLHYRTVVVRIYYIFEPYGVSQIMRTRKISMTIVRHLSLRDYQTLLGM